jgi:hypothetical protein
MITIARIIVITLSFIGLLLFILLSNNCNPLHTYYGVQLLTFEQLHFIQTTSLEICITKFRFWKESNIINLIHFVCLLVAYAAMWKHFKGKYSSPFAYSDKILLKYLT